MSDQPQPPHLRQPRPLPRGKIAQATLDGLLVDAEEQARRWRKRYDELIKRCAKARKR